jgi:hypothetical protein
VRELASFFVIAGADAAHTDVGSVSADVRSAGPAAAGLGASAF